MISVIIPALNEEEFIGDCLRSLKRQNYEGEYEIIVMDNGSEDDTAEIAREIADEVICKPDMELNELRNEGIRKSKGEIIATTDADCIAPPNWLSEIKTGLEKSELVTGPFRPIEDSRLFRVLFWVYHNLSLRLLMNTLKYPYSAGGNSGFYKKRAIEVGGYKNVFPSDITFGQEVGNCHFNPQMLMYTSARRYEEQSIPKIVKEMIEGQVLTRFGSAKKLGESYYWSEN